MFQLLNRTLCTLLDQSPFQTYSHRFITKIALFHYTRPIKFRMCIFNYLFLSSLFIFRVEDESEFREFLDIVAVVLCSDIEISPNTFHKAARGHGVSNIMS